MEFSVHIILFLIFSFVGFVIDSTTCSISQKRLVKSGYISYLPLCPLYGFGGVVMFITQKFLGFLPIYLLFIIISISVVLVELIGGLFCVAFLKERLWDYRSHGWNIGGHISLRQSLYWIVVVLIFIKYLFPIFLDLENYLYRKINLGEFYDWLFLALFLFVSISLSYIEFRRRRGKK